MSKEFRIFNSVWRGKTFHFSGIGGVSMSGLASILQKNGYKVQGSDICPGKNLEELIKTGVKIFDSQEASNLDGADIFVRSLAIKEDNPEYMRAREIGMPVIQRHELLGEILENFQYTVAVSGTHGKTTVSSIIGYILRLSKLDPNIHIGSDLFYEKHGTYYSGSDYFVLEACEYGNSFHCFKPYIGVVLNIEPDHLDFFKDIQDVLEGFAGFVSGIKDGGYAVWFSGDKNTRDVIEASGKKQVSYGFEKDDDYMATDIHLNGTGSSFSVYARGRYFGSFRISIPGLHNVQNALCAVAVCDMLSADLHFIKQGLLTFRGADRRLEYLGKTKDGILLYDDYAHHPTEIRASLQALSDISKGRVICVFQPHTYTRTKALFDDFTEAFGKCDSLILTPIYAAREKNTYGISSEDLSRAVKKPESIYAADFDLARDEAMKIARPGDLIVSMGAGDIYKVTYPLAGRKS